ncbi:MAG: hypothetical protein EA382_09150 [Spirochaetaceae bacterium]|nr:MAG: hypothetical protein EA382_09150 [Spirochaetaceae bacterium]
MTLAVRNSVFGLGVGVTAVMLAGFAVAGYAFASGYYDPSQLEIPTTQGWLHLTWTVPRSTALASLWGTAAVAVVALAASVVSAALFRRVNSSEIYFMTVFMLALCFELLRVGQPLVGVWNLPPLYGIVLTRVVTFARLTGALSLFAAGVYGAGADNPRTGSISALLAAVSFLIVYLAPVDSAVVFANQLHPVGVRSGVDMMLLFLSIASVANYLIGWLKGYTERGALVLVAVAAVVVGRDLVFFVPAVTSLVIATALIAAGCATLIWIHRSRHLWS